MKNILTILTLALLSIPAMAQNYYFSYTNATYQPLTGATSLNNGNIWDDPSFAIPLGFDFTLYGETSNTVYINGYFYGGTLTLDSAQSGTHSAIFAIGSDILDRGTDSSVSVSNISYKIEGTAGSRIAKIEYANFGFYDELDSLGHTDSYANLQVWLYEGSNNIEIHWGASSILNPDVILDPYDGEFVALLNSIDFGTGEPTSGIYLSGDPSAPIDTILTGLQYTTINTTPANGMVYRFSTSAVGITKAFNHNQKLYPNPFAKGFTVLSQGQAISKIELFNLAGQMVFASDINQEEAYIETALPNGVYFAAITLANGEKRVQKVVKQ